MGIKPENQCACGKRDCSIGIRQDHLGRNRWRIHNYFECYELNNGARKSIARAKEIRKAAP